MMNLSYAGVNRDSDEGEITLSATFRKESSLNRVDIIQDWIAALGTYVRKAATDLNDPKFAMNASYRGNYPAVKLIADFANGEGAVTMPRWFSKAPPMSRLAFLRDWERQLAKVHQDSLQEWQEELAAYTADFRKTRIRDNRDVERV